MAFFRAACCTILAVAAFAGPLQYNRDIRPILSDKCFHCHGADAAAKNIPLRLDSEEAAKGLIKDHRAIVPGDPTSSELVKRITAENKAKRMPPAYSGLTLTADEISKLQTWIGEGATWQPHWSFVKPERPVTPSVQQSSWVRNPIDSFVLERLEREGLHPSPEAPRLTWLRRVTLDLTGLPPTPAEATAFEKDRSDQAYERVVDRLLASPRYGERMAIRWLDAARYADTNGYQYDAERHMWRWRDWVIDSFNRNQPFDKFILEQLAGDLLPNATLDQKIATGFNRNHRTNTEDGIIPEEYAAEYVVDRVDTASTVFLGLTLGCARCHNHKYDPFTQKEYYQLFSYFNNIPELGRGIKYGNSAPFISAPTLSQQSRLQQLTAQLKSTERGLTAEEAKAAAHRAAWEKSLGGQAQSHWAPTADLTAAFSLDNAAELKAVRGTPGTVEGRLGKAIQLDGKTAISVGQIAPYDITDRFTLSAWVYSDKTLDGSVVSRMVDNDKGKGYGMHMHGGKVHVHITSNWADDALRITTEEVLAPGKWHHILATYDAAPMAENLKVYVDGSLAKVKIDLDTLYRPIRNANNVVKEPVLIGGGEGPSRRFTGAIDEVRLYQRVLTPEEIAILALGETTNAIAAKPAKDRTPAEQAQLRAAYLDTASEPALRTAWNAYGDSLAALHKLQLQFPTVMVMQEKPVRSDTFILLRGAYDKPGEKVTPGTPAVLPPLPANAPANRLGLAHWVTSPENPLLARVTVNRFWQMYFGTGIVKTTEDFGRQGEWPSHPELLDWLATEFITSKWDTKALQKKIVLSATYRQSSHSSPELQGKDPDNRLLARGPRFRLPAEVVRDQALSAAGLLVEKVGGPSVKPYQPAGLWKDLTMQGLDYDQGDGEDLYRRSLYTFWKRTIAPPMMANFDSALRESCTVRETRSNTPLQALTLMNDVTFLEASRSLAERMLREGGPDAASKLKYGFQLAVGRVPSATEQQVIESNLAFHRDYFQSHNDKAAAYLKQGSRPVPATVKPEEIASYAAVASLFFNLDETVTKE